jgi:hypothetical protein
MRADRRLAVVIAIVLVGALVGVAVWAATRSTSKHDRATSTGAPGATTRSSAPRTTVPPPARDGYFELQPPGAPLPSEVRCAARVHRSTWEPRPDNNKANHTVPRPPVSIGQFSQYTADWNLRYRTRVTGNFKGTTDEIIQWAACKWGWSDNIVRAEAVRESKWHMSTEGDTEPRSRGHCTYDETRDPCPTSFGIMQIKWYFHPEVSNPRVGSSYPLSRQSTAFNIDMQLAEMRGCYDGMSTYLGNTRGDVWGCIGYWFSGAWHTPPSDDYASIVQEQLDAKRWRSW